MSDWKNVQYKDGKMRTSEGGGGGGSSTFAGLDDVSFSNLANGQVPKYNSTTQKWENANESGGTVTDVKVDGQSVVNSQGVAEIKMPTPPAVPVVDVKVNGVSVVDGDKEAQIKSYKEVTQAEYNALPDSKLNDDILYAIKDSAGADGFPPLIYSDEEREVGVWRDGKPLYQKVLRCNFTESDYDFTIDATYQIKVIDGIVYAPSGDYSFIHLGYGNISSDKVQAYQPSSTIIRIQNSYYVTRNVGEFIVQYTKTTDVPGSGKYTSYGGMAHHYSTTEQVIGTWVDGKPLYQKTINFGALPNNTTKSVSHGVSNADFINVTNAFAYYPNAQYNTILPTISLYNVGNGVAISVTDTTIDISTTINYSGYTNCYVTIQYTKNTD